MANALLLPGFLNHALTFGFRVGSTQIAGCEEVERFLSEPNPVATLEEAWAHPAFQKICGVKLPALPRVFGPGDPPTASTKATANERAIEGFLALMETLCDGLQQDLEDAMTILATGSVPVADHDPAEYDAACIAFEEAVAQARNEARYAKPKPKAAPLLHQLSAFTDIVNNGSPMDLVTWSLRTMAYLPSEWEIPVLILKLATARMEWKMLNFGTAADTLRDIARDAKALRSVHNDLGFEGQLHYLAGTALLVTSFSETKDAFGEAIEEFREALSAFEQTDRAGPELYARFAVCFDIIGGILESRGRHEEADFARSLCAQPLSRSGE